jgi:DNA-binding NtrC family response regulator
LTKTRLLERKGDFAEALQAVEHLIELSNQAHDALLGQMARLAKAEVLLSLARGDELACTLSSAMAWLPGAPLDLYAQYERILACALAASGDVEAGRAHMERARRIYTGLRTKPGLIELDRRWDAACAAAPPAAPPLTHPPPETRAARAAVHSLAGLLLSAGRPELLAREMHQILTDTAAVDHAAVLAYTDDRAAVVAETGIAQPDERERRFAVGRAGERRFELVATPRRDIEAATTVDALGLVLAAVHEIEQARAEREDRTALWPAEDDVDGDGRVASGQLRELFQSARRVATTSVAVLITGESGTGKEVLARAIHRYSARAARPFVPFNCAAVPRDLVESQLFGHRRGSFTGADRDHPGVVRGAAGGTLFLDEIGELGLDLQPKLLRFLEAGEISPIGEAVPLAVDVRIVAATNKDLEQEVRERRFREDLFYRLNVVPLRIPPLRDRRDEIPAMVRHFTARAAEEFRKGSVRVAQATLEHLLLYNWPGNVRQLQNELRRMVALAEPNAVLQPSDLTEDITKAGPRSRPAREDVAALGPLAPELERVERRMIRAALTAHGGRVEAAAQALGISRKGLYLKRQRLGI